jgi:hypothetical protein
MLSSNHTQSSLNTVNEGSEDFPETNNGSIASKRSRYVKKSPKAPLKAQNLKRKLNYLTRKQTAMIKEYLLEDPDWTKETVARASAELNIPHMKVYKTGIDFKRKSIQNMKKNIVKSQNYNRSYHQTFKIADDLNQAVDDIITLYNNEYAYVTKIMQSCCEAGTSNSIGLKKADVKTKIQISDGKSESTPKAKFGQATSDLESVGKPIPEFVHIEGQEFMSDFERNHFALYEETLGLNNANIFCPYQSTDIVMPKYQIHSDDESYFKQYT